jgi:hypothetical protein
VKTEGKRTRREFLKHAAVCGGGIVSVQAAEGSAGADIKPQDLRLKDLKGTLPQGTIGKLKISRVILGGNPMGGGAHSRDLTYAGPLLRAYHTEGKIFETFELAERSGINTFLAATGQMPLFNKYRELNSSKMQTICQVMPRGIFSFLAHPVCTPEIAQSFMTDIDRAIDYGVNTIYVNGSFAERLVQNGRIDLLAKALDRIKKQGYPAGLGGHSIEVPIQCEKAGLEPDYYVKTLHHDQYWSAHPREKRVEFSVDSQKLADHNQFHDNIFDLFPEKTIEYMQAVKRPWIAFKVLAAGAIPPPSGFKFAFENGADFICVGMLDFQIVENVNTALDVLANVKSRPRPWCA